MNSIEQYYAGRLGEPARRAEFRSPDGATIEVLKWGEHQTGEGVAMYATVGASSVLGDDRSSCEFFIGLTPEVDDIASALAEIALHGNGSKAVPALGDSTKLAYPLWKGTQADCCLFTDGKELLPPFVSGGRHIEFIQLVPLFKSELAFKKQRGEHALWQEFERRGVPYWSSLRKPALPG